MHILCLYQVLESARIIWLCDPRRIINNIYLKVQTNEIFIRYYYLLKRLNLTKAVPKTIPQTISLFHFCGGQI